MIFFQLIRDMMLLYISVYEDNISVGTICCRIEKTDVETRLYLMTMGILAVSAAAQLLGFPFFFYFANTMDC